MSKHQHVGHRNVQVPQFRQANPTSSQKGAENSSLIPLDFNWSVGTFFENFSLADFLIPSAFAFTLSPAASSPSALPNNSSPFFVRARAKKESPRSKTIASR